MSGSVIVLMIIAAAGVIMLLVRPAMALGYLYCVGVGLLMAGKFLYPFTSGTDEVLHCLALGGGVGSVFGLFFALVIATDKNNVGGIIGCIIAMPIVMLIAGFFLVLALGFVAMIKQGMGMQAIGSAMIAWAFITSLIGSGGSILILIFKK